MSTHLPGFWWFFIFLHYFALEKLATTCIRVNWCSRFLRGIRLGLVVTMPGSQAWVCKFESPLDIQVSCPGFYINVRLCGGLSMVLLQLKDPLELFVKRREFLHSFYFITIWPKLLKAFPPFLLDFWQHCIIEVPAPQWMDAHSYLSNASFHFRCSTTLRHCGSAAVLAVNGCP